MTDVLLRMLGGLILLVVFVGAFRWLARDSGWRPVAAAFAASIAVTLVIIGALYLVIYGGTS